jgi:gliding motility-associated-like protein
MPTLPDITTCDVIGNTQNGITQFNLTTQTPIVLAAQTTLPLSDYTVTYYTSLANATLQFNPIVNTATYTNTSNPQTIWTVVKHNVTGCFNIGTFELHANIPLALTTPTPLSVCDSDLNPNNLYTTFNLTVKDDEITGGLPYTVTYYPNWPVTASSVAIPNPTNYPNALPAVQTLGVMVTTPDGCKSYTTLDIRVLPIPAPRTNPPALAPQCDNNLPGDMLETFNLTVNAAYIMNSDPSLTLHYYPTQANAIAQTGEFIPATAVLVGTNVWIRVENNRVDYQGNNCYVLVEQALRVNPLPSVEAIAPYSVALLGALQLPADYTVSYYATLAAAQSGTGALPLTGHLNTSSPDQQTIYIRVVNNTTGCVNATGTLSLVVEEAAFATGPQIFTSCDDYDNAYDGVYELDLTQFETAILNGQDPAVFLISYYTSQADADSGTAAIADPTAYITDADTDQVWVKVVNSSNLIVPKCYALTTIDISIERYPNPVIATANDIHTICVDFTDNIVVRDLLLDSQVSGAYTYQWYENGTAILGETASTYLVDEPSATGAPRIYTVEVISDSALGCTTISEEFEVIQSGQAEVQNGTVGYTVTNAFSDNQIITVLYQGWGTYEFSLDNGPRQVSNIFENVSLGTHTITIWDTEGGFDYSCDEFTIQNVQTIDYPHYFTPNGDGIHDNWNIVGLGGQVNAKIYIFDRFGKLIKQISSAGTGWDGTYNGQPLPATDYWFTVDYLEQVTSKQFKAHFSLKR